MHHSIGAYRTGNILEVLLAHVCKLDRDLATNLIVRGGRDANAAGFGYSLKPSCDVDAIAKYVVLLDDHIADVYSDTEKKAPIRRVTDCKLTRLTLEIYSRSNRFDGTLELGKKSVACVLDNPTSVFGDCRFGGVCKKRSKTSMCSLFVVMHKPGISSYIGGQYRR